MNKEALYSARYKILKEWPEGVAKRAILATLRPILGPEPAWYSPGGEDAPETLPYLDAPETPGLPASLRFALITGHNSVAPGAWLKAPIKESEFTFWNKVFQIVAARGIPGIELRLFNRQYTSRGYAAEIDACYAEVNRWAPHGAIEGHFNGGNGHYSFTMAGKGRAPAIKASLAAQEVAAARLGISSKGVIQRTRSERGGRSLFASKCPMGLLEWWFGDNVDHSYLIGSMGHEGVADLVIEAIKAFLSALYEATPAK